MRLLSTSVRAGLAAAALAALGACAGTPATGLMPASDCFSSVNWRGWSSPVDDVIYLRVGLNDIYRVDLLPGSGRNLEGGGDFLVSEVRGSNRICSANDLDLRIASTTGFTTPLFPRTLRKLTPEEVAALPADHRP
ncbi:MAG TPA: hypothetical protein VD906_09435 [Caulobacteraceae bacterium]|nr:hypothetical protein [Caulobacteraceae bacterium]